MTDQFELGDGNFTGPVTVGQYAKIGATTELVPSATIPTSGFTIRIEQLHTVSQGTTKQAQNLDQNTLDSMFIRLYGNEMFRTLPAKQRNLMLMRGRGRR